mmetsp:Transcript_57383/g.94894  ORF Transcript_57383/g.94894 Transcript_57383/m.94894 type:complete len:253 (-) Transcript_57383:272-1030(-)
MLSDGSNPEGIDPIPALEWKSKQDLTDVKLVSIEYSPPCAKLRYHLSLNDVPYTIMSPKEYKAKAAKDGYTKIPVIFVAGRQVNDSYVILKHLVPALYGRETLLAVSVDEWEQKITFGFQLAMEVEAFEDAKNYPALCTLGGFPSFVGKFFWFLLPLRGAAASIRRKRAARDGALGPLRPAGEYAAEFREALGTNKFCGGERPGSIDVSFYATVVLWQSVPSVYRLLKDSDLLTWIAIMKEAMPTSIVGNPA